jgi:hypothetical protein
MTRAYEPLGDAASLLSCSANDCYHDNGEENTVSPLSG